MFSNASKFEAKVTPYAGLKACCRHISMHGTLSENNQFAVGTSVVNNSNQIQIIEYDNLQESIQCLQCLKHPEEVWWITCHPSEFDLMFTVSARQSAKESMVRLFRVPEDQVGTPEKPQDMEVVAAYQTQDKLSQSVTCLLDKSKCMVTCKNTLNVFNVDAPQQPLSIITATDVEEITASAVDPIHANVVAACVGNNVTLWDIRSQNVAHKVEDSKNNIILTMAFNESKPWWICTGGTDGYLRCWDVRVEKPKCEFKASSHWVTCAIPSSSHEQLILTAGTDSKVRVINSSDFAFQNDGKLPDGEIIKSIRHDDSVYSVAWSTNPWVFASVSYKGQVNVCQFSREFIDSILLGDNDDLSS